MDLGKKTDGLAQYVDDIGVAAHTASEVKENFDHVFQQIEKARLKLSLEKRHFGKQSIEFLGKTISTAGTAPIDGRAMYFLKNSKLPSGEKTLQRFLGFVNFYRHYIRKLANKMVPFFYHLERLFPLN